ncbi:MAG: hypothetical protein ACJ8AW_23110 [Rhodopila sp.]
MRELDNNPSANLRDLHDDGIAGGDTSAANPGTEGELACRHAIVIWGEAALAQAPGVPRRRSVSLAVVPS